MGSRLMNYTLSLQSTLETTAGVCIWYFGVYFGIFGVLGKFYTYTLYHNMPKLRF